MMVLVLAACGVALAVGPAILFLRNLALYAAPPSGPAGAPHARRPVSVLIPARNEEAGIEEAVRAALASRDVEIEVCVMDDGSTDDTADIVRAIAAEDPRIRLASAPPLPPGWNGKQHACWRLAALARHPILAFVDADVRLAPDALARAAGFLRASGAALVSGVPRQLTGTWLERLALPLIHFVLLAFLPLDRMRRSREPAYGAGCGQLMVADRRSYLRAGGHRAIRASRHDGVKLPRAFREAGYATDLFDATTLATCRMYRSPGEVWQGLAKNATEGLAAPRLIVPATVLLLGGQVLPFVVLLAAICVGLGAAPLLLGLIGVAAALLPRFAALRRFDQGLGSALLHPLGVTVLVAIQWHALLNKVFFRRVPTWKGRVA
ncbi:MAG: glycosyltransferase [Planctomycetota bacterium]|nr:MAG: glycosyltransferase [Planctomycetota bacterium]